MPDHPPLLLERQGAVAIISINDAPLNHLSLEFMDAMEGISAFLEKRDPVFNQ
jgi:enoyl-CoA hydratase/carnithine racemase